MPEQLPRLTAAEAAARLGVKQATLYAYVSRGLLSRERTPAGSSFDPLEVEGFARVRRRDTPSAAPTGGALTPSRAGTPLMVLDTDIARIEDDELFYRERRAAELIDEPVEEVAAWLWRAAPAPARAPVRAVHPADDAIAVARALVAQLPPGAALLDRVHAAVMGLASADPLRYDATAENVRRTGGLLLTGIPRALAATDDGARPHPGQDAAPEARGRGVQDADDRADGRPPVAAGTWAGPGASTRTDDRPPVAATMWHALGGNASDAAGIRALNAALVLTVDHDLAVSTLAARVAASARASGYAVVTAALGAFDSPLHGNASRAAAELLAQVVAGREVGAALAAAVRDGARGVPGFGHPMYSGPDARARALLPLVAAIDGAEPVLAAVDAVTREVSRRAGLHPNVDLALGALAIAAGLPSDAGTAIFAVGRIVGWIAHALDEYEQRPMRLRPRGRYVGP